MRASYRTLIVAAALAGTAVAVPSGASAATDSPSASGTADGPAAASRPAAYAALPGSTGPAPGRVTGRYDASHMTVEVSLVRRGAARTAKSVQNYLHGQGLASGPGSSPTLIRASGSSAQVSRAFHTTISTYAAANGTHYYANSTPVYVPASLAPRVIGVLGLSDTQHARPLTVHRA